MTLTIVGLGPGDIDDLTRKAWRTFERAGTVYLRTERHPCVPHLPPGSTVHSFDDLYDRLDDFEAVYATIVERLIEAAKEGDVVYAVPGDPLVGESTTTRLLAAARAAGIKVEIVNGISFIEPMLALVEIDALDNLQIIDGLAVAALHHPPINPDMPAILGQVYSREVASHVKLTLMNQYPDDFPVRLIHAAGTPDAIVEALPLYEIDRSPHIGHMTALYLPPLGETTGFEAFQEVIAHLRAPEGCPWDRQQTHESLRPFLLEEAHEVLEAIDAGDVQALAEELGDLMLQIVLHTQIAIDDGEFTMSDVIETINQKMIRRHPHVWGDVQVAGAEQVLANWEDLKREEHVENGNERDSLLDGVPKGLPALLQAHKYQAKAAKPGFDWDRIDEVVAKVREEIVEIEAAETDDDRAREMGDLLFALVNWARWLGVDDPESALRQANARFYQRFRYIEQAVALSDRPMTDYSLAELDALWDEAKANGL
jgi:tetrapyrrole methylase family protein/MazG family protein